MWISHPSFSSLIHDSWTPYSNDLYGVYPKNHIGYYALAFDKIEWTFIRNMLHSINLLHQFIKIILSCISTFELVILLNGQATPSFNPTRGVKEGDPLSPYLFILGMEFLSMLINQQVSIGSWQPTPVTSKGPNISHTLFADDVFLFAEATHQNATTISYVLQDFTTHSGLQINCNKSKVFFSKNCPSQLSHDISNILSISITNSLGTYLGFPLLSQTPRHVDFEPILQQMRNKLANWITKHLT